MLKILYKNIKELLLPQSLRLDGEGERIDLNYNKKIPFNKLDLYQKSHYRRYEFAKSLITPDAVTGDFACGTGYGSAMLAEKSRKVIGVDLNAEVINQIRIRYKNIKNVEYVSANLLELTYQSSFDNIVSFETVEHLEESDIPQLFNVFSRVLKPGGKFIFSTPYLQERSPEAIAMGFHRTFYIDEAKINKWLSDNGLVADSFNYQNYQTHDIVDELSEKDFIICVARKA